MTGKRTPISRATSAMRDPIQEFMDFNRRFAQRNSELLQDKAVLVPLAGLLTYTDTVRRLLKKGREPQQDVSANSSSACAPVDALVKTSAAAKRGPFIERLTQRNGKGRQLIRSTNYFNL